MSTLTTTSPRGVLVALGVTIGSFITLQSLLVPVLPIMQQDLRTSTSGITWTLTAWLIAAAVSTPLLGRVGDLVGKRRVLLISIAAVAVGSVIAALAPNLDVLILARVIQGMGGAIFPLSYGLVRDALPPARVAGGIGILSAITALGSGLGTVLAGPLSTLLGWRGLFIVPLAGAVVGVFLVLRYVPAFGLRAPGRINVPAALLLSGWLVALLLPLSSGTNWGWASPLTIGLFALAAVLLSAWIIVEVRSRQPLVDMRMMSLPGVWNTNAAAVLLGAAMFAVWAYFARFVQEPLSTGYGLGLDITSAGLIMLPMLLLMGIAGFFTGRLSRIVSFRTQLAGAATLIALATLSIGLLHSNVVQLVIATAFFGLGLGVAFAATTNIIVQSVPPTQTGVATGMNANLRTIGSSIGTAIMTVIVTGTAVTVGGEPTEAGYTLGFVVLSAFAAGAVVLALVGRRPRTHDSVTAPVSVQALVDA
ncbi:N/A [soil metagenome]